MIHAPQEKVCRIQFGKREHGRVIPVGAHSVYDGGLHEVWIGSLTWPQDVGGKILCGDIFCHAKEMRFLGPRPSVVGQIQGDGSLWTWEARVPGSTDEVLQRGFSPSEEDARLRVIESLEKYAPNLRQNVWPTVSSEGGSTNIGGVRTVTESPREESKNKRFRVAISFAGEKRGFVEATATKLAKVLGKNRILYDKFLESEFARTDLGIYLPNLYHDESDLVVVVLCDRYKQKEWTGLEWTAIHDIIKTREYTKVMPCRFGYASVDGLYGTSGFIQLDDKTPDQFAELILERLATNEGLPKEHYL